MRRSRGVATLVGVSLVAACAGGGIVSGPAADPPSPASEVVSLPYDEVWGAVIKVLFERSIPVKTLEKVSGLIESDPLVGEVGRECDCGSYLGIAIGGYGAYGGDAFYRFRILVEPAGNAYSRLTVRSTCSGQPPGLAGTIACRLSPAREKELATAILNYAKAAVPVTDPPESRDRGAAPAGGKPDRTE